MSKGYKRVIACLGMAGAFIAEYAIQIAVMIVVMVFLSITGYADNLLTAIQKPDVSGIVSVLIAVISIAFFGLAYYLFRKYGIIGKEVPQDIIPAKGAYYFGLVVLGTAVQAFGYGALNFICMYASDTEIVRHYNEIMQNLNVSLSPFILLYACVLAPISEEIIFRGVTLDFARTGFRTGTAVFLSAILFGIFHMNIIQGIYAAVFGIILGYVRVKRNSLVDSVITHMTINIAGVSLVPVAAAFLAMLIGNAGSYAMLAILGLIVITMWFLRDTRTREEMML